MLCANVINYLLNAILNKKKKKTQSSHLLQIPLCRVAFWFLLSSPPQQGNKCSIKAASLPGCELLQMKVNSCLSKHCEWQIVYQ